MTRPLAVDLCCGLSGWGDGLIAEGWRVRGYDIEDMFTFFGIPPPPAHFELVIQNVLSLRGANVADADLLVASPPCQFFSYTAMPWKRAKILAAQVRADSERLKDELAIFDACFRIQREASEAAGRQIPLVVENVCGAQKWVGRAKWHYGSYYLWGDVPALMPIVVKAQKVPGFRFTRVAGQQLAGIKMGGDWFSGYGGGFGWDCSQMRQHSSKSPARKAASAMIAKIPFELAQHIAWVWKPKED